MDFLITNPESLTWLHKTIALIYIIGLIFCIYLRGIINDFALKKQGAPVRYMVLLLIWIFSPAVILGLLWVTFSAFTHKSPKS